MTTVHTFNDDWLMLDQAASEIAKPLKRPITETDLLRFAGAGDLQLSIRFPTTTQAKAESDPPPEYERFMPNSRLIYVDGVWDIVLDDASQASIERRINEVNGQEPLRLRSNLGYPRFERPEFRCELFPQTRKSVWPDGSYFVLRRPALDAFVAQQNQTAIAQHQSNTPLSKKQRNTLLRVISAMANMTKLDLANNSTAAAILMRTADTKGDPIPSQRTLEGIFKEINTLREEPNAEMEEDSNADKH